ncbi:unnamed protein product [Diamesa hyperborea]
MDSIQVSIKIRPLIHREKEAKLTSLWSVSNGNTIKSNNNEHELSFDHILDENASTEQLFNIAGKRIVSSALKGINGTIFAYGQTSSGKTYSMLGNNEEPGIVTLVVREIFKEIEASEDREFLLRIGYVEIYNEKIFDLLDKDKDDLKIHETQYGDINIQQREVIAKSENEILGHFDLGNKNKRMGETGMNEQSSRSHTIFRITIESREQGKTSTDSSVQISNLNLVDLAGSERASQTKATGNRAKEGAFINKSLLFLSLVIQKLSEASESASNEKAYINFRDSKLTRILQASLGGNALTSIICTITPAVLDETYYTLTFAQRAKKIKNKPKVNEVVSEQVMMKRLEKEISRLRLQLSTQETKISAFQTNDIEKKIADRVNQFLHSHNVNNSAPVSRTDDYSRRRTWCPTSTIPVKASLIPKITMAPPPQPPSLSLRRTTSSKLLAITNEWLDDEEFSPGEDFNLDRTLSPLGSKDDLNLNNLIRTPRSFRPRRSSLETPNPKLLGTSENLKARCDFLQLELDELNDFTKLETEICDDCSKMELKLKNANEQLTRLEFENEQIQAESAEKDVQLMSTINELKLRLSEAENKKIASIKELENSQSIQNSLQYEYDSAKTRAKKRETELINSLDEARDETKTAVLNDKVTTLTAQLTAAETANFKLQKKYDDLMTQSKPSHISPEVLLDDELRKIEMKIETPVDSNISILTARIEELEKQLASARQEVLSTQTTLKEKSSDALQIQNESDELSTQLMESLEEMDACRVTIKNLEETLLNVNTKSSGALMQFEQQLAEIKSEKEICSAKMQELEKEVAKAQENNQTIIELEQKLAEINSEKEICSVKMQEMELELIDAKKMKQTMIELEQQLAEMKSEKEICSAKMQELEFELILAQEKSETLINLEQQLSDLKSEKEISLVKMQELEQVVANAQENNQTMIELEQQLANLKSEKEISLVKMQELEQEVVKAKENNDTIMILEQQLAEKKSEKEISSIKMQEMEQELIDAKEKNQTLVELEQQLAEMKIEKEVSSINIQELEQVVTSAQEKNENLINLEQQLAAMNSEKETLSLKIQELEKEVISGQEKIASLIELQQQLADLKCEKEISSVKVQELEYELISAQEKNDSLVQFELTDVKCEKEICSAKIQQLEQELNIAKENNEVLVDKTKMLQSQSDRLSLELESLISEDKATNIDFQNQLESTAKSNTQLKEKVKDLESVFEDKEMKIKELEDAMSAQEHEMTTEIADLKKGLTGLITMEEENIRLKNVERQHKKCGTKLQELQEKEKLNEALEMELKTKYAQINELETTVQEKDTKIDELTSKMSSKQEETIVPETNEEVVRLQQQLNELKDDKKTADVRIFELEEEISKLNENYKLKMNEIISLKTNEKEALKSANNALLENDKLRLELSNVIKEHQQMLDIEAKKYSILLTETDEERMKSIEEMDEIIAKLNSSKSSLEDAKLVAMDRDLKLTKLELQISELQTIITERDGKINHLETVNELKESEAQTVDANLINVQTEEIETLKSENKNLFLQNTLNLNEINEKLRDLEAELSEITEELRDTNQKNTVLEAEVTNRDSRLLLNEETIGSLRIELEHLKATLQDRTDECAELKTRYRRRSCDGEKKVSVLEAKNTELLQENGAIQALKLAVENELKKLKIEWQQMLNQQIPQLEQDNERLKSLVNEHDFKYSLLDEKYCQIVTDYEKLSSSTAIEAENKMLIVEENELLQKELESLNVKINEQIVKAAENDKLNKQYEELKSVHLFKVQQLQEEIEKLQKTISTTRTSPSSSNRIGRTSLDDDLFVKQQLLFEERRNTPKRTTVAKVERKNRRQSVHDDNRRLSVWEMHNERECQTDPVDENCACAAMNEKIVKLSRDLRIKECQMQNYEKMSKINPLQLDVEELKKALSREQKTHSETRRELNETNRFIKKLELKISELQRNQIIAVHKMEISTQTQEEKNVEMELEKLEVEHQLLEKKHSELKRLMRIRNDKIQELEHAVDNQKENYGSKANGSNAQNETEIAQLKKQLMDVEEKHERLRAISNTKINGSVSMIEQKIQTENVNVQEELDALNTQLETVNKKYDMAKRLCNLRNDDLSNLRVDLQQKSDDYETLMIKYSKVKVICQHRNEELNRYRNSETGGGRNTGLDVIIE